MALRQQQVLKQTQRLSPLQMQVIKLVELNTVEVEDRIKQEVEENPALETDDNELSDDENQEDADEKEDMLTQEEIMLGDYFRKMTSPTTSSMERLRKVSLTISKLITTMINH